jgi:hypothetical protein
MRNAEGPIGFISMSWMDISCPTCRWERRSFQSLREITGLQVEIT